MLDYGPLKTTFSPIVYNQKVIDVFSRAKYKRRGLKPLPSSYSSPDTPVVSFSVLQFLPLLSAQFPPAYAKNKKTAERAKSNSRSAYATDNPYPLISNGTLFS